MRKRINMPKQAMTTQSDEHELRPWLEVARLYRERTGEKLTPGGAWFVGMRAIAKMRKAMMELDGAEVKS